MQTLLLSARGTYWVNGDVSRSSHKYLMLSRRRMLSFSLGKQDAMDLDQCSICMFSMYNLHIYAADALFLFT
jgi:hypothetical protein